MAVRLKQTTKEKVLRFTDLTPGQLAIIISEEYEGHIVSKQTGLIEACADLTDGQSFGSAADQLVHLLTQEDLKNLELTED